MEFDKNAGATTVSYGLILLKWAAWVVAGLSGALGAYIGYSTGIAVQGATVFFYVIAGIFYFVGKGVEMYHNSILVKNQNKEVEDFSKELISIIGEDDYAEVEELEVRVNKINADIQESIQQYLDEGGINEETADAIIEAKTRAKSDIDNLAIYMKMSNLNRKLNILNNYLQCHVDALGKAAELYRDGKTPATVKRYYHNEVSNNISGDFMESFIAALMAKNIDKFMIQNLRKNPNQQSFDTQSIQSAMKKQAAEIEKDDNLTIAKLVSIL